MVIIAAIIDAAAVVVFICNHFPFWIWIGRRHVANLRPGAAAGMKGISGHCGDGICDVFSLLEFSSLPTAVDIRFWCRAVDKLY